MLVAGGCVTHSTAVSLRPARVEQWDVYEIALPGPRDGNPFVDVTLTARFTCDGNSVLAHGFYDGDGIYRVRFMPESTGTWRYETQSNRRELAGKSGQFTCVKPTGDNHG